MDFWPLSQMAAISPSESTSMSFDKFLDFIIEKQESSHWLKSPRRQLGALSGQPGLCQSVVPWSHGNCKADMRSANCMVDGYPALVQRKELFAMSQKSSTISPDRTFPLPIQYGHFSVDGTWEQTFTWRRKHS
jgi:hypothetical protein